MNATTKSRSFSARRNRLTDRTLLPKTPLRADLPGRRGTEPASVPPSVLGWMRADGGRTRVLVVAENRLLREALCRMFMKQGTIEIANSHSGEPFQGKELLDGGVDVMLVISSGHVEDDLEIVRQAHAAAPRVRILMIGTTLEEGQFLQCVRAGISGFLWREASADDVVTAIRAVQSGEAVCPGALSAALFRYFEQESSPVPCAGVQQRMGFTRREQQLIPFIAKGLTNKEIANHFCLSEQTVKNHLYRMKHKAGADDRLSIVQRYRIQGFLL
jgi:DNA-binding NarL/FixJ family response regulator